MKERKSESDALRLFLEVRWNVAQFRKARAARQRQEMSEMRQTAKTMTREEYRKACKYVGVKSDGQLVCRALSALLYHTTQKIANVNCKCNCPRMRRYDRINKDD